MLFVFFLCSERFLWGGELKLDLRESVVRGVTVSHRIEEARKQLERREEEVGISRSALLPRATMQIGGTRIDSIMSTGPSDPDYNDQTIKSASAQLRQILFAGGSLVSDYLRAKLMKEYAEAQLQQVILDVVYDVQRAFLEFLKAQEEERRLELSVERLKQNVEIAKAYFDEGLVTQAEFLQAKVDLENAMQQLERARADTETARQNLNSLLDIPLDQKVIYTGRLKDFPLTIPFDLKECMRIGLEKRPEKVALQKAAEAAQKEVYVARGGLLPRVEAVVSYTEFGRDYKEPGYFYGIPYDRDQTNHYWSAAIQMNWSLGLGGEEVYRIRAAQREVDRLRERMLEMDRTIGLGIENAYVRVEEAKRRIKMAEETVSLAEEAYRQAQAQFMHGVSSLITVLDAQERLSRSEASRNQAYLDFQLALARLFREMGLRQDDLGMKQTALQKE